jgi:tetratricopeptide (TPR) repeat protein
LKKKQTNNNNTTITKPLIEMKKVILILLLAPAFVFAQKPVKPNLNKAVQLMQEGKLGEAKDMIDAATTYEKTMNDGKTWYYRGLIYSTLDTTSNETFKSLAPNALEVAIESFKKADQMATGGKEYFISDPKNIASAVENTKPLQLERLANYYLDKGIKQMQLDEPDYIGSIAQVEKSKYVFQNAMTKYSNDTLAYYVLAIAAQNAEKYDTALRAVEQYLEKGGKAKEAYIIMYQIYVGPKADKEKALEIVRDAKQKMPHVTQFPLIELELLIDLKKTAEAKAGLEEAIRKDPQNKTLHFYLGYTLIGMEKLPEARKSFEDALKIDPKYFDAQLYLARVVSADAKAIKRQINSLGITAADKKKKMELDGVYVEKLKTALPFWEKAEKLNPSDEEVLTELYSIYSDLGNDAQVQRVEKRMKELGIE